MSAHQHGSAGHGDPGDADPREHEVGIDMRKVVLVGLVSLVAFAVCSVAGLAIIHQMNNEYDAEGGRPPAPLAIQRNADEIGIVEQVAFSADHRLAEWKASMATKLNNYGWVDKSKGVVRLPIDTAVQAVIDEAKAGAGK